jgi:hypothetical protein
MAKGTPTSKFKQNPHHKHPGIHGKSKMSKNKTSKHYVKISVGQGR